MSDSTRPLPPEDFEGLAAYFAEPGDRFAMREIHVCQWWTPSVFSMIPLGLSPEQPARLSGEAMP